jgi:AraC family L-rhamnose operon regulatory protein RhaS
MKHAQTPIYHAGQVSYGIDRCDPQVRAINEGKIEFHALTKGHYPGQKIASDVLAGLNSIGFWDAGGSQDWGSDAHRNEGIEISFLETGLMPFTVDRRRFDLRAGNITITRPWQLHKLGVPNIGPGRLHWLILDVGVRRPNQDWHWPRWVSLVPADLKELTRKLRHNENPVWNSTPAIMQSFRGLGHCIMHWNEVHSESRMIVHLNQLLLGLLDALTEQQTRENPELTSRQRTVELFLREVEQNPEISREVWTIDSMAERCGMGVTAFSKYCRQLVNTGPVEYLNQCRLEFAARRLRAEPSASITGIAYQFGFNASQYFATRFRQRFGCSPREFRRRETGKKPLIETR